MIYIRGQMLEALLGSQNKERVLVFIFARGEGYARDIARFFATGLTPIQKQLENLENGGVLVSRFVGRTRLYTFDPHCPFLNELKALIAKGMACYPKEEQDRLQFVEGRPKVS